MSEQVTTEAHLTIVDTNDIESITIEYAKNQSTSTPPDANTGGWSTTRPNWAQGYYIWQRTRIHKTGTAASTDTFGAAVCLTGSAGQNGTDATIGWIGKDSQSISCTSNRVTTGASTVTIPFTAYKGNSRIAATIAYSTPLPNGVTLNKNTAGTASAAGSLVLNIANGADLGGTTAVYDNVTITLTITANSKAFTQSFTFSKSIGEKGDIGPEATVTIIPSNINWDANNGNGSATLTATLRINGTVTTPASISYKWTEGTDDTRPLGNSSTLDVSNLNATYNCTVTWE